MNKKFLLIIIAMTSLIHPLFGQENAKHLDRLGNPIPGNKVIFQENILNTTGLDMWEKFSFPYQASYIYRAWIDGSELHACTTNNGLHGQNNSKNEHVFYGKICGNAFGINFDDLGIRNMHNFKNAILESYSVDFFSEFAPLSNYYNCRGTCVLADGKEGSWHFYMVRNEAEWTTNWTLKNSGSLHMLLVISFERDSAELLNEMIPVFL